MATERVSAVRIACQGEAPDAIKEYQIYSILPTHDIFKQGEISPLSQLVGCPILVMKLRPSLLVPRPVKKDALIKPGRQYSNKAEDRFFENPVASMLMAEMPSLHTPTAWNARVGSVLMARVDKQPLHPLHLTILIAFNQAAKSQSDLSQTPFEQLLIPEYFQQYYPFAVDHIKKDPSCPADVDKVLPLYEQENRSQTTDVEGGGVPV
ncbi:uncharacterized protein MYCFIDRAFT_80274 [Pseudocercospora fijiensis CIRAD86]|uniref:Uncharacterized protein n=1 Tax=Pseudocercospora fijiensis (strain CIRAD86) TaxID=383855 RepID=M2ZUF7_PSEFD|nr:uncharacterized protein MYCFIDRAFT_80274 [Pseudocercospora fijiensis CIRAD86]EME82639.1 hypothetical protein MYCFIDRAFT_80274 [Pseudocercospora fijiensis CIRAD86]